MRTFIRGWVMWTLFVMLMALPFAPLTTHAQDTACRVLNAIDDVTGEKLIVTICDSDIGGENTPFPTDTPVFTETPTPVGTPTRTPTATPVILPTLVPGPQPPSTGLWISKAAVEALPQAGAWSAVLGSAGGNCSPDLTNQDSACNVTILAQALAWARTDDEQYRTKVVAAITSINAGCGSVGGRTLALGRELGAYIAAADLIDLRNHAPAVHNAFKLCLNSLRTKTLDGMTLVSTHERRPNNWGTMAGASRAAIDVYTGDRADLDRTAAVFDGWAGNRSAYSSFTYGDLSWQCNSAAPVGVNLTGCQKSGHDLGGALPDDMRRGGAFKMPPSPTGYACGAMSGAVAQAWILHRAGYPAFEYGDKALLRAMEFLQRIGWKCTGDDAGMVAMINYVYGTDYPVEGTTPGKNFGWQQWTHAGAQPAADVITVDETHKTVTGESVADLADEIAAVQAIDPAWMPVGEVYRLDGGEDGELFAQDMERQ